MSSEVMIRKRKNLADSNSRPKIPKLIPIHKIFESAQVHNGSDSFRHRRLQAFDRNNNNDSNSNEDGQQNLKFEMTELEEQSNSIEAADRKSQEPPKKMYAESACASSISSSKLDSCQNSADQEQHSIENNSKRTQTDKQRRARQSFLLITVIDHNKILRVYCHDTTKQNCVETKAESDINNNESSKYSAQFNANLNNNSKIISPIRLAKSKDGSWHPKDTSKVSMQDFEMQTDSPKQVSKPVSLADFQAEIEFSKNLLSNFNELNEKKSKIDQLNELKSHLANYQIKDPILIPKVSWKNVLENPYKGLLQLFLDKPQFYFRKDGSDETKCDFDYRNCERIDKNSNINEEHHLISLQLLEEILRSFAEHSMQSKSESMLNESAKVDIPKMSQDLPPSVQRSMKTASKLKATATSTATVESVTAVRPTLSEELTTTETGGTKDFDEIDNERTALFNQLTLMKYWHETSFLPSPKSLNVNYTNNSYSFNNFNNVSDQLLKKLFFNNTTATASAASTTTSTLPNNLTLNQQAKTPKFFSNCTYNGSKSNGKSHGKKFSRILDLSRTTNVPIVRPNDNFNYFINNKPSLDARSSALYDFHF